MGLRALLSPGSDHAPGTGRRRTLSAATTVPWRCPGTALARWYATMTAAAAPTMLPALLAACAAVVVAVPLVEAIFLVRSDPGWPAGRGRVGLGY